MEKFKGTKGDWRVSNDGTEITTSRVGILEGSKSIAIIRDFGKTEEEVKANAQLIAKAPELLETLLGLVSDVGNLLSEYDIEWQEAGYYNHAKELTNEILKPL